MPLPPRQRDLTETPAGTPAARETADHNHTAAWWQDGWRYLIGLGIAWMVLGMVVMPAGISFNPSHAYQVSLALLLYLPAFVLAFRQRGRLWRELAPLPAFRVFLLLLAWAAVSLCWAGLRHPEDELGRLVSVLAFVLAWQLWDAQGEARVEALLLVIGLGVSVCAAGYCVWFAFHPPQDERIVGEGIIATANYAAALMGAVALWLTQLPLRARWLSVLRWLGTAALLVFIGLTQARSVWLALAACAVLAPLWRPERAVRWLAAGVVAVALVLAAWPLPVLVARGTSLRPELMAQALHRIAEHPWLGLGQGAPFTLMVQGHPYTHTHNLLTQVTVELGLPGLLLTLALWALVGWQGWRGRGRLRGRILLAIWVYASVVLQFDMPQLLDSPRPGWVLVWLPFSLALALAMRERAGGEAAIIPR